MLLTPNPYSFRPAAGGRGVSPLTYRQTTTRDHHELQIALAENQTPLEWRNISGPRVRNRGRHNIFI